ncbi:MAG TPA: hypothetical protein VL974_02720 [Magnetospirillum sp.]|jgi:hypothetical protein|nr:hypothetical protein [Magnetospirillum sp.]
MELDEDAIRRRAFRTWDAEGRPADKFDDYLKRARQDIEEEFRRATEHVGEIHHRLNPPLRVEEALDPFHPLSEKTERRT